MNSTSPEDFSGVQDSNNRKPRILSIQSRALGHVVYRRNMEKYLGSSRRSHIDFFNMDDGRELPTRVLCRLAEMRLPGQWVRRQNLDIHRWRAETAYGVMTRRLIQRQSATTPYDVVHLQTQVGGYAALDLMRHVPTVVTADITAVLVSKEHTQKAFRWTFGPNIHAERALFKAAAHTILYSHWAYHSLINDLHIPPEKASVIPPGTDVSAFPIWDRSLRAASNPGYKPRILFIGNNFTRKGGDDLLAVFRERFADRAYLDIITGTSTIEESPGLTIHQGVAAFSSAWLHLWEQADLFVLPSYYEGLPQVLMEAAAASLPVISTNINGIPDIVRDRHNGFLITPGDRQELCETLEQLISNATLRQKMGQAGRMVAATAFDAGKNFRLIEDVFLRVAAENAENKARATSSFAEGSEGGSLSQKRFHNASVSQLPIAPNNVREQGSPAAMPDTPNIPEVSRITASHKNTETPFLSVVIPTRHRNEALAACLELLAPDVQTAASVPYEVVVTDDGSQETAQALIEQRFPWVRWVPGPRKGPAANRNNGVRHANAPWIAFTDDDCLPSPDWLASFVSAIRPGESVYEGKTICSIGLSSPLDSAPINETGGWLWSCNMMLNRSAFDRLNGFDENFPSPHLEDVDLRERLKENGYGLVFVPDAVIDHPPKRLTLKDNLGTVAESDVLYWYKQGNRKPMGARIIVYNLKNRFRKLIGMPLGRDALVWLLLTAKEVAYVSRNMPKWERKYRHIYNP